MKISIKVSESKVLIYKGNGCIGSTGENNSTIFHFTFPQTILGKDIKTLKKKLIAKTSDGVYEFEIINDEFAIPQNLTQDTELPIQISIVENGQMIWKSYQYTFHLQKSLNSPESVMAGELFRKELANSMTVNVGGVADYNSMSFEEIVGSYSEDESGNIDTESDGEEITLVNLGGIGHNYTDGELYKLASRLNRLKQTFCEDITQSVTRADSAYSSIEAIEAKNKEMRRQIVGIINDVLQPDVPYSSELAWPDLLHLIEQLPNGVQKIVMQSVENANTGYRRELEAEMSKIIVNNDIDFTLLIGEWQITLEQLPKLCNSIYEQTAELVIKNFSKFITEV